MINKMNLEEKTQKEIQKNLNLFIHSSMIIAVMTILMNVFGDVITLILYSFILLGYIMVVLLIEHKHKVQT